MALRTKIPGGTKVPGAARPGRVPGGTRVPGGVREPGTTQFRRDYRKPGTGNEWIRNDEYEKLSPDLKTAYDNGGFAWLEAAQQAAAAKFESAHRKPGAGKRWIRRRDYRALPADLKAAYDKGGFGALTAAQQAAAARFESAHRRPGAGKAWIRIDDYRGLPEDLKAAYDKGGVKALESAQKAAVRPTVPIVGVEGRGVVARPVIPQKAADPELNARIKALDDKTTRAHTTLARLRKMRPPDELMQAELKRQIAGVEADMEKWASQRQGLVETREALDSIATARFHEGKEGYVVNSAQLNKADDSTTQARESIMALSNPDLAPFISLSADGYAIDVFGAVKAGIKADTLKTVVDGKAIRVARAAVKRQSRASADMREAWEAKQKELPVVQRRPFVPPDIPTSTSGGRRIVAVTWVPEALQPYAVRKPAPFKDAGIQGYDIARYLRDNPGDTATLRKTGFSARSITEARTYNRENPWAHETLVEKYHKAVAAAGGTALILDKPPTPTEIRAAGKFDPNYLYGGYDREVEAFWAKHPNLRKMRDSAFGAEGEIEKPTVSWQQWSANFLAVRGLDPKSDEGRLAQTAATWEYQRRYGPGATGRSQTVQMTAMLFSPARVMYPEVTFRDIRGAEWAVGAAQVALLAAPFVAAPFGTAARGVTLGLQAGAGATFGAVTAIRWKAMSPVERAISVALDTVILGAVLKGARVVPRTVRATNRAARATVRKVLTRTRVEKPVISQVDRALSQIVRGIETKNPQLVKLGEANLRTAMDHKSVPPAVRRIVADGGSYIRRHAIDYPRLVETTRRMNAVEASRARRLRTTSDTRVPQKALQRMVTVAENEAAKAKAIRLTKLEKLRQSYIRGLEDAAKSQRTRTVRQARVLAQREAAIQAELERLKRLGMSTRQQAALWERWDLETLRNQARRLERLRQTRLLEQKTTQIQAELERFKEFGMTARQERALLAKLNKAEVQAASRKTARVWGERLSVEREAAIEANLKRLKEVGMTPRQEAAVWKQLEADYQLLLSRKFARIKETRLLVEKEAAIQAELQKLKDTGMTTRQQKALWDRWTREHNAASTRRAKLQGELARLDRMFERTSKSTTKATDTTLDDIDDFLKRKASEPPPETEVPPPTEAPSERGGVAVKEKTAAKAKPKVETKPKETTKAKVERETKPVTETGKREQQRAVFADADPLTVAVAQATLAGVGMPVSVPVPTAIPLPVPSPGAKPLVPPRPEEEPVERPRPRDKPRPLDESRPEDEPRAQDAPSVRGAPGGEPVQVPRPVPADVPGPQPEPARSPAPGKARVPSPVATEVVAPEPQPQPQPAPQPSAPSEEKTRRKLRLLLPEGASDSEKRSAIRRAPWAVGFRMGELAGEDAWRTYMPDGQGGIQAVVVRGKRPAGARVARGAGSAYRTIQRLRRGRLPKAFTDDIGAFTATIAPGATKPTITFRPDVGISRRRTPRITPPMPRLR